MLMAHAAQAESAKFVPPDGKVILMAGQDMSSIDEYVKSIDVIPAGVMFYTSIQDLEGIYEPADRGGGVHCGQYLAEKYPNTVIQVGLWMVDVLDRVNGGDLDGNIDKLGEWIKSLNRPVYLRIGYEFDLPQNRYEPAKYAEAFRHIADRLRKNGIDNVAFVWHSYAAMNSKKAMDWYPGDGYVDWFGISYFAQDRRYMEQIVRLAREHDKPVMIGEATPFGTQTIFGERSWNNWFAKFFKFAAENDIKAICYINYDWESYPLFKGQGWGDARIQGNKTVRKKWIMETKKSKYLKSSRGLFVLLGYK
jgi:hypothetical protein